MVEIFNSTASTDMATTNADTAVDHDVNMTNLGEAFLLTKVKTIGHVSTDTLDEAPVLVLCYGDAAIADIATQLITTLANRAAGATYKPAQVTARHIIDFRALDVGDVVNQGKAFNIVWDLPRGGLPSNQGDGFKLVVFNHLGNFSNGPTVNTLSRWMGVFL